MHFPHRIPQVIVAAAVIVGMAWIWVANTSAETVDTRLWQEAEGDTGFVAHVHAGDCNLFNPTQVLGSDEGVAESGNPQAQSSYSFEIALVVPMSALVEEPHAITIESISSEVAMPLACGEIAGTASDGRLVAGIWSVESDVLEGVAVLEPAGEESTKVSVYLILSGEGAQPEQEDAEDDDGSDNEPDEDDVDDPEGGL